MIPQLAKATVLRGVPLFSGVEAEDLVVVAALAEEIDVAAGARIFAEGEIGDALYVVVKGGVRIERHGATIAELGPGECVGELALLDDAPRSATVVAVAPTELLRIGRDDFLDTLSLYPGVARAILEVLARRLRGMSVHASPP